MSSKTIDRRLPCDRRSTPDQPAMAQNGQPDPGRFFMTLRDIGLWVRSARTDAALARYQRTASAEQAFDQLYRTRNDPWGAAQTCYSYQRLKYEVILSMLPSRRYASALDAGCGLGVFTRRLAATAEVVLGVDISRVAVEQARALSVKHPNVRFESSNLLSLNGTDSAFDLVVLADVLYYLPSLSDDDLTAIATRAADLLLPEGILLVANHCFFNFDKASKLVRRIHSAFRSAGSFEVLREEWHPFYLTTVFKKR